MNKAELLGQIKQKIGIWAISITANGADSLAKAIYALFEPMMLTKDEASVCSIVWYDACQSANCENECACYKTCDAALAKLKLIAGEQE